MFYAEFLGRNSARKVFPNSVKYQGGVEVFKTPFHKFLSKFLRPLNMSEKSTYMERYLWNGNVKDPRYQYYQRLRGMFEGFADSGTSKVHELVESGKIKSLAHRNFIDRFGNKNMYFNDLQSFLYSMTHKDTLERRAQGYGIPWLQGYREAAGSNFPEVKIPTIKNKAAEIRPWLIIWNIAPFIPFSVKLNMPPVTYPIWATDEYAIIFFISVWT